MGRNVVRMVRGIGVNGSLMVFLLHAVQIHAVQT